MSFLTVFHNIFDIFAEKAIEKKFSVWKVPS